MTTDPSSVTNLGNEPSVESSGSQRLKSWLLQRGPIRRWSQYRVARAVDTSFWRERDPEENASGRLPADQAVEIPALWVVEFYTPSTVGGFLDGISRLEWDRGRTRSDSLIKWMADVRHGRSAGWTNLGIVSSPSDRHFAAERIADLPAGIRAVLPTVMSVTPSVTALVAGFMLTDEHARLLEGPLRAEYETYLERDDRFRRWHFLPHVLRNRRVHLGHSYQTPQSQRQDNASKVLDDLEAACTDWVTENLPGVFAGGLRSGRFPTAMLFVSNGFVPMTDEAAAMQALRGTGLDRHFDVWESNEWPHCRMTLPRFQRGGELRLRFAGRRDDAFPDEPGYFEPQSNWTVTQRANERIPGLTIRWALSCLLDGYHQVVSAHRDRSAGKTSYRPVRDVRRLRALVSADIYDALSAAREVPALARSRWHYAKGVLEPEQTFPGRDKATRLLKEFRSSQKNRGRQLKREAALLLSTLSTSADLTETISGIRIQRFLVFLTAASIAIALIAIYISLNASLPN